MALLPPSPIGQPPGNSFWNDWYEKLRTIINTGAITVAWANVTGTPTTLAGYGITAVPAASITGVVAPANGGTGVANNAASTITIAGAFASTFTMTGVTSVTFPTSGTLMTTTGNTTGSAATVTAAAQPAITSVGTLTSLTMSGAISGTTDLTTTGNTILGNAQADTLNVGNGDIIKDSSGRVGFGVTPQSWSLAGTNFFELGGSFFTGGTANARYGTNAYFNGASWIRISANATTLYNQSAGVHLFYSNASGAAGGSFTQTEVARIDGNGLLTTGSTTLHATSVALTNGAGAGAGTITNAPAAGNPTKWIPINDNGTTRYIPAW